MNTESAGGDWPAREDIEQDPAPDAVQSATVNDTPWGVVGQEYGKFHKRTKALITWAILVVGLLFALNYGSAQVTGAICYWAPNSEYFCDSIALAP